MDYKDGFYMLRDNMHVYCDMETTPREGWTLLVASNNNGWNAEQVSPDIIYQTNSEKISQKNKTLEIQ